MALNFNTLLEGYKKKLSALPQTLNSIAQKGISSAYPQKEAPKFIPKPLTIPYKISQATGGVAKGLLSNFVREATVEPPQSKKDFFENFLKPKTPIQQQKFNIASNKIGEDIALGFMGGMRNITGKEPLAVNMVNELRRSRWNLLEKAKTAPTDKLRSQFSKAISNVEKNIDDLYKQAGITNRSSYLKGGEVATAGTQFAKRGTVPTTVAQKASAISKLEGQTKPQKLVQESLQKKVLPEESIFQKTDRVRQAGIGSGKLPRDVPSLDDSIRRSDIDVKSKVGILDKLRTPDRVLKKIGLEKEANLLRTQYDKYLKELPVEINKITDWSKKVSPQSNQRIFQYLDGKPVQLDQNELKVAGEIKDYLSEWATKLKLPADKRISHYITHIFEKDFIKKEFDPDFAKLIQNKVPGSVYDPFLEQRLGKLGFVEDTWRALDAYVKRATRKYNIDVALEPIKKRAESLELSQYNYVKSYIDRINLRPTNIDNDIDNTIKQLFGYKYGQRPTASLTRAGRQMVYRGTLGLNPGTALKNLTQGANTYAKLGEKYTITGYIKNAIKMASGDDELQRVGILKDEFIQDRTINATKKFWEKIDKGLFVFFDTAEKINRGAAYFGAKSKALAEGLPEDRAIEYAKKVVRDTQFTFGSIDTPPILQSDIGKLLGQFQSFSLKQGEFLGEMLQKGEVAGLARYALAATVMATTVGKLIGMEWKDFIPSFRFGLPPTLQAPIDITKNILGYPDKYGNIPDTTERVENIGKSLIPFIPAGKQIRKTIEGLGTVNKGYSESRTGRVRTPVDQSMGSKIKGALFGQHNLPELQEYYDKKLDVLGPEQSEIFKQLTPEEQREYFNLIQEDRQLNKEEQSALDSVEAADRPGKYMELQEKVFKKKFELSNQTEAEFNGKVYIRNEDGDIKTIKLAEYERQKSDAQYSYYSDQFKDKGDITNWASITEQYINYLKEQKLDLTGKYDEVDRIKLDKKIGDLEQSLSKYRGQGGFKKKAKITIKKVSMRKVIPTSVKKISIPAPRYRKIKGYTITAKIVTKPKITATKLDKWTPKAETKFTKMK